MSLWNPVYRVKVDGVTVTSATLSGLTITSGRTDIYQQPIAGYCNLSLIETAEAAVPYEVNDSVTIEVQDSNGNYVNLFGATTQWQDAENSGLGEIDTPGDYELHSETGLNDTVYNLASRYATSGLGYLYEDAQGRIGYADSTHRSQYLATNGYVDLDGNHAIGPALSIVKRAGDVRNAITVGYGIGSASETDEDAASISLYGQLATTISTTLRHQADAEAQAAFYLLIRAYPQFALRQITFTTANTEIDDADRDSLLNVFMGMPLNITNLPSNMTDGEFQGFVEGWTWTASLNRLDLTMNLSPIAFSLQAFRWNSVPAVESWNTINPLLEWFNATIVA